MNIRARIASLERLAERSNSAEIWYAFADNLVHIGESVDEPNVAARALEGFRRAEAIDSSFTPALEHQAHLSLYLGDIAGARAAHARQARRDSTGDFFVVNEFEMQLAFGDTAQQLRAMRRVGATPQAEDLVFPALFAHVRFGGQKVRLDIADSALAELARRVPGQPSSLVDRSRREIYWNTGRPAAARRFAVPNDDIDGHVETVLAGVISEADTGQATRSAQVLEAYLRAAPTRVRAASRAEAEFALAQRALARGDTLEVERRLQALRNEIAAARQAWAANPARVLEAAVSAQLGVARQTSDARTRVQRLDSLVLDAPNIDRRLVRTPANMVLAALWERLGNPDAVVTVTARRDGQTAYSMYHSERLRLRARAARTLGRDEVERSALEEFLEMRAQAEPQLRPELERIRARLAELNARTER
jgi:hypothetical protein